jgi:hypothetical protein
MEGNLIVLARVTCYPPWVSNLLAVVLLVCKCILPSRAGESRVHLPPLGHSRGPASGLRRDSERCDDVSEDSGALKWSHNATNT